jgi:hypothetical protein
MKISKKEIIIRLLNQIYDLVDYSKELENELKEYKENDKEQTITSAKNK